MYAEGAYPRGLSVVVKDLRFSRSCPSVNELLLRVCYRCGKSLKQEAGDRVGFVYDKTRSFVPWYRESRKSKEQQTLARKPRGANAFLLQQIVWSNAF